MSTGVDLATGASATARSRGNSDALKRLFDICASAVALLILAPVMAVLAVWVAFDSPGGVFYRGVRAGRWNRPFRILKFRTMVAAADAVGGPTTSHNDSRVTRAGRVLRRYKLDELPQLFNVLKGDMSLVGPRPQVVEYARRLDGEFREIMTLRPGITDWASIWNADESAVLAGAGDAGQAYDILINPTKVRLQLHYARTRTFSSDLRIIAYTLFSIVNSAFYPRELAATPRLRKGSGAAVAHRSGFAE